MPTQKGVTLTEIYIDDMGIIDSNKTIKQEPRRDSLHRLIQAGKRTIDQAKEAAKMEP